MWGADGTELPLSIQFASLLLNSLFQALAVDMKDPALGGDFKNRSCRWAWRPAGRLPDHMGQVEMRGIIAASCVDIKAVPLPIAIHDGHCAPPAHGRHNSE